MKWVMPHAKKAALSTVVDVAEGGKSLKSSLKRNGLALLKDVGTDVLNSVRNNKQTGKGLGLRKKKNSIKKKAASKPKPKSKASKTSKRKATAKKNSAKRTRLDIFV